MKPNEITVICICQSWNLASQEVLQAKEIKESHSSLGENIQLL